MVGQAIDAGAALVAPPRARMAFRVGVVGHRPDRLPEDGAGLAAIRERIAEVLACVAEAVKEFGSSPEAAFYAPGPPILRALSPLAEGADRDFAEAALARGYELCCIMPFAQGAFEEDFHPPEAMAPDALERFRDLLARAGEDGKLTKFELDGARSHRAEAYQAAGRLVLNQSDLLIVVWDGGGANGVGGTVDTLRQAVEFDVPVLWIDARAPFGWRMLRRREDLDCLTDAGGCPVASASGDTPYEPPRMRAAIAGIVVEELGMLPDAQEERAHLGDYLSERRPRFNLAFAWKLFRDLLDRGELRMPPLRVRDYVGQIQDDWPVESPAAAPPRSAEAALSGINGSLRTHYAWSDKLADRYADAHRSGFIWSSLFAASAVFLALLPMAASWAPRTPLSFATAGVEALVLLIMVGLPLLARRRRWHQRWLEYRILAELIRELRVLIPLGGGRPLPRTPAHLANYGDPTQSWMYWQVRAVARAAGLPDAEVTAPYAAIQLQHLSNFVGAKGGGGQIDFHHNNCERLERIHHRLHQLSLGLFSLTIAGVAANWLLPLALPIQHPWVGRWLILTAAFFPALGAALATINNQGEFARLQRRSRAMSDGFEALKAKMAALRVQAPAIDLAAVTDLAGKITAMMVDENIDWRIVVLDLPHAAG